MLKFIFILWSVLLFTQVNAQQGSSFEESTDAIFQDFSSGQPGITMGIIQNGDVLYLKGFGTADLASNRPIDLQTKFQADDFAKQFTVLSILILEEQGRVNFEDDIRKYLPQLPNYSETIKLKHVVNHSTGLNDYYAINRLTGASTNDIFTHEDALRMIFAQKELNHPPGTSFSLRTSDTEATLLAEVVQQVTGQSLAAFADQYIFTPLKMNNTLFADDHEMLIPNLAKSYQATEDGYKKRVINSGNAGPTNLYTSAEDMAIWYAQFSKTKTGFAQTIQKLHTPIKLDNGKINHNSWGIMSLARDFYHMERGIPKYWLFGLHGGYGANMFLYPEQDIVGFALGNNDSYNGYYAMVPLEPLLEDHYTAPPIVDFNSIETKVLTEDQLQVFEGSYWDDKNQSSRIIYVENDSLRLGRPGSDQTAPLVPLSNSSFQMVVNSDDIILLDFQLSNGKTMLSVVSGGSDPTYYERFTPKTYASGELNEFTGTYYNDELSMNFRFTLENEQLISEHFVHGKASYEAEKVDTFRSSAIYFSSITFMRDKDGSISGFKVRSPGIKNLVFAKAQLPILGSL